MANKTKKTKGGQKTPDKVETEPPTNDDSHLESPSPSDKQPTSDEQSIEKTEISTHVAAMLQGKDFVIKGHTIQHTDGLSVENREIIVDNLVADQNALCRVCITRLRQTFAKINIVGPFGRWLTHNYSQDVHVHLPVGAYYDLENPSPMSTLRIRKDNIAMLIREDLKCQI